VATVYNVKKLSVQWQAGNQCNFRCDYCHSDYHDGSNPFLDYEQFHVGFTNLKNSTVDYDRLEIEFQGGEPTISSAVRDTIISSTDTRIKYVLTTNASASLDWWQPT
jgi:sulfatase maturation enzyme AslB (radical SAM superfamily)